MAVSSLSHRNDYIGNGATSVYAYSFRILDDDDLRVVKTLIATGVETVLTKTTDYTVSGVGDSGGGNVTLVAGSLASTYSLTIRRVLALTQETDLRNQGAYFPEDIENEFDRGVMIAQQQQDAIDRSLKLPESVDPDDWDMDLPTDLDDRPGEYIRVNDDGDGFTTDTASQVFGEAAAWSVHGTRSSPEAIVAGTGLVVEDERRGLRFVQGSGGAADVSANPQISAGTNVGDEILIIGRSDSNTVKFEHGTGLELNGQITLQAGWKLWLVWDGTNWTEVARFTQ